MNVDKNKRIMPSDPRLTAKANQMKTNQMKNTNGNMHKKKLDEKAKKSQEVNEKFFVVYFEA